MNVWRVEVTRAGVHKRALVRLEDRLRTREQAIAAAATPEVVRVTAVTQRCTASTRFGTRCRKFTSAPNGLCQQHGGDHERER